MNTYSYSTNIKKNQDPFVRIFRIDKAPLKYRECLVYSAGIYKNHHNSNPRVCDLVRATGLHRNDVSGILYRLKDVGLYDGQYLEPPLHWFHTKKGKEHRPMWESLAYFTFCPPATNSPLTITQALIFARLKSLPKGRKQTHSGLAILLKMSRQTIITNCKALIGTKLIDSELHPMELTPETARYFMSKTEMLTMKVPPPEEEPKETKAQPKPSLKGAQVMLDSAKKQIDLLPISIIYQDDILTAYSPLARFGVWFDVIESRCKSILKYPASTNPENAYAEAIISLCKKELADIGGVQN